MRLLFPGQNQVFSSKLTLPYKQELPCLKREKARMQSTGLQNSPHFCVGQERGAVKRRYWSEQGEN